MGIKKVLVLDDNRFNREIAKDALMEAGFNAETVEDLDAFEKAVEWWRPDAAVVDVNMPGTSGVDVVKRIKATREKPLPVVLLSAMADGPLAQLAQSCGADAHFSTLEGVKGLTKVIESLSLPSTDDDDSGVGW